MKFMEFLFYAAICISLYFLGECARKSHMKGAGLNNKIKPYHQQIATLLFPYEGTTFYKEVMIDAQTTLKELLAEYGVSREGEMSRTVIDSRDNRDVVRVFALLYIYWHRTDSISSEEKRAILSLKKDCAATIKATITDVPDCFWAYFDLSPTRFTFEP